MTELLQVLREERAALLELIALKKETALREASTTKPTTRFTINTLDQPGCGLLGPIPTTRRRRQ